MMKIRYYLSRNKIENLYCRLSEGNNKVIFSLRLIVDPNNWSSYKECMRDDHVYHRTLRDLRRYLSHRHKELSAEGKEDILEVLKNEINTFTKDSGIQGIDCKMFDYKNRKKGVPRYDDFCLALEKYTGLAKKDYKVRTIGSKIVFHTGDEVYLMDTYEGKTAALKSIFASKSYIEIWFTELILWKKVFYNRTVSQTLLSEVSVRWIEYWDQRFQQVLESGGKLSFHEKQKELSFKRFERFKKKYKQQPDPFLALGIDHILYGIVMYVWVTSYDIDKIFSEYCDYLFSHVNKWESVSLEDDHSSILFQIISSSSLDQARPWGIQDVDIRAHMEN